MSLKTLPHSSGTRDSYEESAGAAAALNTPPTEEMMDTSPMDPGFAEAWESIVGLPASSSDTAEVDLADFGWNDLGHGNEETVEQVNVYNKSSSAAINTPNVVEMEAAVFDENEENAPLKNAELIHKPPEVLFEFDLPVVSTNFELQWDRDVFANDPYKCFNPLDVEGKELAEEPSPVSPPVITTPSILTAKVTKHRPILPKLIMPTFGPPVVKQESAVLSTPSVESVLKKNVDACGFDLLEFVTNKELPVNDPTFLSMIGDINPSPIDDLETIDLKPITKGNKGKSSNKRTAAKTSVRKGRVSKAQIADHSYDSSTSNMSSSSSSTTDFRYRRMRDLNNLASKRCRANRKNKFQNLLTEEEQLIKRNSELRMKCKHMEDLVAKLKKEFIQKVTNPAAAAASTATISRKENKTKRPMHKKPPVTLDLDQLLEMKLDSLM